MAFTVTARKYRPQRFEEVVGQEHITQTLKNAIQTGRIAHAYLFTGPRGVGKTTTARILAKSINCEHAEGAEPCNACEMCQSIQTGQLIDIIEIDAASNRGIDEIRSLRESVQYAPAHGKYKVYIIDEVHMLTKDSFNAFLKTLEEPPPHIVFIFATTDVHRVPLTILSRCQRYDFRRIQLDTIKKLLSRIAVLEEIEIDDKTLTLIAKKADGGLRDAESFFDQVVAFCGKTVTYETVTVLLNVIDDDLFFSVSDAIVSKDYKTAFSISEALYKNGWNYPDFAERLVEHFRNILVAIVTGTTELVETAQIYREKYLGYRGVFTESDILRIIAFLGKVAQELRYSPNQKIKLELAIAQIIGLEQTATITDLIREVEGKTSSVTEEKKKPNVPAAPKIAAPEYKPQPDVAAQVGEPAQPKTNSTEISQETISAPADGNEFQSQWEAFVKKVVEGKRILLSGIGHFLKFEKYENGIMTVSAADKDAITIFRQQKDYLEQKAGEFFKKKIVVKLIASKAAASPAEATTDAPGGSKGTQRGKELPVNDEYVQFIIKEMGGEQIT